MKLSFPRSIYLFQNGRVYNVDWQSETTGIIQSNKSPNKLER